MLPPGAPVPSQIHLRDDSDFEYAVRWTDNAGVPYDINAGRLVIRQTEAAAVALIDKAAVVDASEWATFTLTIAEIVAVDFDALTSPAQWGVQLTRTSDGRKWVAAAGDVIWKRGVVR